LRSSSSPSSSVWWSCCCGSAAGTEQPFLRRGRVLGDRRLGRRVESSPLVGAGALSVTTSRAAACVHPLAAPTSSLHVRSARLRTGPVAFVSWLQAVSPRWRCCCCPARVVRNRRPVPVRGPAAAEQAGAGEAASVPFTHPSLKCSVAGPGPMTALGDGVATAAQFRPGAAGGRT
jgi:hypothetical protein